MKSKTYKKQKKLIDIYDESAILDEKLLLVESIKLKMKLTINN